ncbi:MAG: polysaccharide deacetylase family protein, partial [Nitrososphaeraceae archaeon]|nr:polysaccharide deacetylase family protein [Nitrososphaeraceae archaeon]
NAYSYTLPILPAQNGAKNSTKLIVLAFDDSDKSQFTLAKPILDKYDFKGSFFTVCNAVNNGTLRKDKTRMTWQDIKTLEEEGHDIESHSMTHTNLDTKSEQNLVYEIGGSKQCLLDNVGVNSTIFAYPASTGHSNATVVNVVSKYYDLARTGDAPLAFLHCNGYKKYEKNCSLSFDKEGKPTFENRYDIRNWSDRPKPLQPNANISYDNSQMFLQFIQEVNLEENYDKNGCINAIPIVVYHDFEVNSNLKYLPDKSYTDVGLFSAEMKYLQDNEFKVIKMSDIGYNQNNNYLYIDEPIINDNTLAKNA